MKVSNISYKNLIHSFQLNDLFVTLRNKLFTICQDLYSLFDFDRNNWFLTRYNV